jgi:hypothetical protein
MPLSQYPDIDPCGDLHTIGCCFFPALYHFLYHANEAPS